MFAQRFQGLTGSKHCNSLEGTIWREVVSTTKKTILERDQRLFAAVLSRMINNDVDARELHFLLELPRNMS